jgi:spore coat protein U-like protein
LRRYATAVGALLSTTSGPDGPTAANHKAVGAALLKTSTATSIAFGKYGTAGDWASSTSMVGSKAVQVFPITPTMNAPGTKRCELKHDMTKCVKV